MQVREPSTTTSLPDYSWGVLTQVSSDEGNLNSRRGLSALVLDGAQGTL